MKIIIALNLVMTVLISVLLIWGAVKVRTLILLELSLSLFGLSHNLSCTPVMPIMLYELIKSVLYEQISVIVYTEN